MSEHMFGVIKGGGKMRGMLRGKVGKALQSIAEANDADFVGPVSIPGNAELAGWFTCPNRGSPFDRRTELAVAAAVEAAGYGWINGLPDGRRVEGRGRGRTASRRTSGRSGWGDDDRHPLSDDGLVGHGGMNDGDVR